MNHLLDVAAFQCKLMRRHIKNIIQPKELIALNEIEVRRDGEVICVCKDETCLYPKEIMNDMKNYGYKFYQNGKIYKHERNVKNESKN